MTHKPDSPETDRELLELAALRRFKKEIEAAPLTYKSIIRNGKIVSYQYDGAIGAAILRCDDALRAAAAIGKEGKL